MINDQFCGKIGFVNNFAQKLCCFYNFMFHLLGRVYECVTAADSVNCKCGSATYNYTVSKLSLSDSEARQRLKLQFLLASCIVWDQQAFVL